MPGKRASRKTASEPASKRTRCPSYSKRSRTFIGRHVRMHRHEGMEPERAVAAAMSEARRKRMKVPRRKSTKRKPRTKKR